jgi:hypothetical protein
MPIGRVASQAGDFETHDDAGFRKRDFADEFLEAVASHGAGSGLTQVASDDVHPLYWPTCRNRAIVQSILALCALAVLGDLTQG